MKDIQDDCSFQRLPVKCKKKMRLQSVQFKYCQCKYNIREEKQLYGYYEPTSEYGNAHFESCCE